MRSGVVAQRAAADEAEPNTALIDEDDGGKNLDGWREIEATFRGQIELNVAATFAPKMV